MSIEIAERIRRTIVKREIRKRLVRLPTEDTTIEKPTPGIFSAAYLTYPTAQQLYKWAEEEVKPRLPEPFGELVPPEEYHSTIVYSRQPFPYIGHGVFSEPIKPEGDHVYPLELLGKEINKRALVLVLNVPKFTEWHEKARDDGASWDFPSYKVHITVAHSLPDNFDFDLIPRYEGEIAFRFEEVKPLEEDYYDKQEDGKGDTISPNQVTETVEDEPEQKNEIARIQRIKARRSGGLLRVIKP